MINLNKIRRASLGTAMAAALAAGLAITAPVQAFAQSAAPVAPENDVTLSAGTGRLVRLNGTMSDVFVANDQVADVQVRSPSQIFIFGKAAGNTSVYATDRAGRVIYSANVRVGQNLASVGELLDLAMPEADIQATPLNGTVLLTGRVLQPADAEEAERLVQAFVGEGTQVISRLRTATPQQVMLQVKIAEVSRSLVRQIGTNIESLDGSGGSTGFVFGRGRDVANFNPDGSVTFPRPEGVGSSAGLARSVRSRHCRSPDLNEIWLVTTLAEPTLLRCRGNGQLPGRLEFHPYSQSRER